MAQIRCLRYMIINSPRRQIDSHNPKRYISSVIWPTSICSILDSSSIVRSDYRDRLSISYTHTIKHKIKLTILVLGS